MRDYCNRWDVFFCLPGLSKNAQQGVNETHQLFFDMGETAAQSPNVPHTNSLWRKIQKLQTIYELKTGRRGEKSLEVSNIKWKCSSEMLPMPSGEKGFGKLPQSRFWKLELQCLLQEKEDTCRLKIHSLTKEALEEQSRWCLSRRSSGMLRSLWVSSD